MTKPQIGLIGCFQNGKSTLVNCLLGNRVAITGEGVAKTKKIARYVYGETAGFFSISPDDQRKRISREAIYDIMLTDTSRGKTVCEMALPSPLLEKVDIIDTPGFDADQNDTSVTTDYLPYLDFIFFVVGRGSGGGGLNSAEKSVLSQIVLQNKPFSVLFNCRDLAHWNPHEENVRMCINQLAAVFKNNDIRPYFLTAEDFILPVNLAWYWQSLILGGLDERFRFFEQSTAEKRLLDNVENHFYDRKRPEYFPSVQELIHLSNIELVRRYITAPPSVIAILAHAIPVPTLRCELEGTSVRVSWEVTDPTYICELSYRHRDDKSWITLEPTGESETVSGLGEGQTYEFRIRAMANYRLSVSKFSPVVSVNVPKKPIHVTYKPSSKKGGMMDDLA